MATRKRNRKPSAPKKKIAFQLTRKGVWLWILFFLFNSTWLFVLGILVGRGTAPIRFDIDKLQKELVELKEKTLTAELKHFKIGKNRVESKPDFDFHEALKETKEDISLPVKPLRKKKKPVLSKPVQTEKKTTGKNTHSTALKAAESSPAGQTGKPMAVQVASVKERKDADRLVNVLKKRGFPAYRTVATVPGKGVWFRVRIGPHKNRDEADRVLRRLKKEKFSGFVVNY